MDLLQWALIAFVVAIVAAGLWRLVAAGGGGRFRLAEVGKRHADRGDGRLLRGRQLRRVERCEDRDQRLVAGAEALVPALEIRAVPFRGVASFEVSARVARVEEFEKEPLGLGKRRAVRRERTAASQEKCAAKKGSLHGCSIKGDVNLY